MKNTAYILSLAVLLMTSACSKDENLADGFPEKNVCVAFTAQADCIIDEATRATATEDDKPERFFAQAVDRDGNKTETVAGVKNEGTETYSFSLKLYPYEEYDIMFWADNAGGEVPKNLEAVAYEPGKVAFAAKVSGKPESMDKNVKLKYVVTKVTLVSTVDIMGMMNLKMDIPTGTAYDVMNGTVVGTVGNAYFSKNIGEEGIAAGVEVVSGYVLPTQENRVVTIKNETDSKQMEVGGLKFSSNSHVTLKGNLSESNSAWKPI